MKAIQFRGHGSEWLFLAFGAAFAVYLLHPSEGRFAICAGVGALSVIAQIGGHPDRWRSRTGSLMPATALVAWVGFATGTAVAWALLHSR